MADSVKVYLLLLLMCSVVTPKERTSLSVNVEYCGECGYSHRYGALDSVLKKVPGVKVTSRIGRPGSFEVTINEDLVFSKLKTGSFPNNEKIVSEVRRWMKSQSK